MAVGSPWRFGQLSSVHPDRRQSPRYDMTGPVFLISSDPPVEIGRVRDISLNGCFINSHQDLPDRALLKFQFKIGAEFEMVGIVCRKERSGFAVRFNGNPEQH